MIQPQHKSFSLVATIVIADNYLEVWVVLIKASFQGVCKGIASISGWDDDRKAWANSHIQAGVLKGKSV